MITEEHLPLGKPQTPWSHRSIETPSWMEP